MTLPMRNQKTVYFDDERLTKLAAIQSELSKRAGVGVGVSAVIGRAIDDLFLVVCPLEETSATQESRPAAA